MYHPTLLTSIRSSPANQRIQPTPRARSSFGASWVQGVAQRACWVKRARLMRGSLGWLRSEASDMIVRFMTYNILDGGATREQFILEVLQAEQPDIVLLQEIMQAQTVEGLAQALGMNRFLARGNTSRHLALLARFPIVSAESFSPFPPIRTTVLQATVECASGKPIHLLGVHLVPHPFVLFELWRIWEMRVALSRAQKYAGNPCLIAGDFNAVALGDGVEVRSMPSFLKVMLALQGGRFFHKVIEQVLSAGFADSYRLLHPEEDGFTLPTPTPTIRLDYIFVNEELRAHLRKCYVVRQPEVVTQASDHFPVVAEFAI